MTENAGHREWSHSTVIYEVNIRQFTREGTISAFMPHLPGLKDMGAGILWLMPIHPVGEKNRKGSLGSYYSVKDYKAVNPEFGTLDELINLVKAAHKLGMKVILDWVANHTAWDNVWTLSNPEYYVKTDQGDFYSPYDWSDVIKLNYDNPAMRGAMIDALQYWIEVADIDGYRCDVAGLVPTDFWNEARKAMEILKPVFMLAEDEENPDLMRYAFDMNYDWKVHHLMERIAKGESNASDFQGVFHFNDHHFPGSVYRMNFITNHDENSWNGTEFEKLGPGVQAFAALAWTLPGMPMMYSGQEAGLNKRLKFFDKDFISWEHYPYRAFYTRLNNIKMTNPALWNGERGAPLHWLNHNIPHQVLAFVRSHHNNTVLAIFNLSNDHAVCSLDTHGFEGEYLDLFKSEIFMISPVFQCTLEPWSYRLLSII